MKRNIKLVWFFIALLCTAFTPKEKTITLELRNPLQISRYDEYVKISLNDLKKKDKDFTEKSLILLDKNTEVPFQIESDKNGVKYISFAADFKPGETRKIIIKYGENISSGKIFKSRTYAEISMKTDYQLVDGKYTGGQFHNVIKVFVPGTHIDHDALFKYEGPGWESEKVGYRFYLDWRNSTDIFGKKVNDLVLKDVGINDLTSTDNDSYHTMQPWGMDIFKVGTSLGIGSIGMWYDNKVHKVSTTDSITCEISENGPIKSEVRTNYYGWQVEDKKFNLFSALSITAGSRLTKYDFSIEGNPENLVTGLAKYEGTQFIKSGNKKGWNYIALYGKQSLAKDSLGIAVLFNTENFVEHLEDQVSFIVKLKPINNDLSYYFCAAWEQEMNGIKTKREFISYLNNVIERLNNPIIVN